MHRMPKSRENQAIEICRLIASVFVIFIHIPFPGLLGRIINCLSKFAVPFFFIVSGYFCYGMKSGKLLKKIIHLTFINLIAFAFYLLLYSVLSLYFTGNVSTYLHNVFTAEKALDWLKYSSSPVAGHLWYLTAILFCYLLFWIYKKTLQNKFAGYLPLYIIGLCLLLITLVCDSFISPFIISIPFEHYRNAWFMGLSLFISGILFHELFEKTTIAHPLSPFQLTFMVAISALLSLAQWFCVSPTELPLGSILMALALLLFCLSYPRLPSKSPITNAIISQLGFCSTVIYIVHLAIEDFYQILLYRRLFRYFGSAEAMLHPVMIVFLSLLAAAFCAVVKAMFCKTTRSTAIRQL